MPAEPKERVVGWMVYVRHRSGYANPHFCRAHSAAAAIQIVLTQMALARIPFEGGEIFPHVVDNHMLDQARTESSATSGVVGADALARGKETQ